MPEKSRAEKVREAEARLDKAKADEERAKAKYGPSSDEYYNANTTMARALDDLRSARNDPGNAEEVIGELLTPDPPPSPPPPSPPPPSSAPLADPDSVEA